MTNSRLDTVDPGACTGAKLRGREDLTSDHRRAEVRRDDASGGAIW
jgi:hypothetical protein